MTGIDSFLGIDWLARKGVSIASRYQLFDGQTAVNNLIANEVTGEEDNLAIFSKNSWQWRQAKLGLGLRYDWIKQQSDGRCH